MRAADARLVRLADGHDAQPTRLHRRDGLVFRNRRGEPSAPCHHVSRPQRLVEPACTQNARTPRATFLRVAADGAQARSDAAKSRLDTELRRQKDERLNLDRAYREERRLFDAAVAIDMYYCILVYIPVLYIL